MKIINIATEVKSPAGIKLLKEAKSKKAQIHKLLAEGLHPSALPEELKIKLGK